MDTLADRIRWAMARTNLSQAELSRRVGLKQPSIHGWLSGKAKFLRGENLLAAATALEVDPDWLATGQGSPQLDTSGVPERKPTGYLRPITLWDDPSELPDDQFVFLPKLDYYLSAGHGGPDPAAVEQTDKLNPFRSDWAKAQGWSPRTHFTMRCKGDSMEPTIQDNAPVVIDTSSKGKRIQSGKVYAIVIDGEALLKRLDKLPGGVIRVRSDNTAPQYQPYEVPEAALEIVGRAVWTPVNL